MLWIVKMLPLIPYINNTNNDDSSDSELWGFTKEAEIDIPYLDTELNEALDAELDLMSSGLFPFISDEDDEEEEDDEDDEEEENNSSATN